MNSIDRYRQLVAEGYTETDEAFALEFARHARAKGQALSLSAWAATMRRALTLNLGESAPEQTVYNTFDVNVVRAAFAAVPNITIIPAREFSPVAFVVGSEAALRSVASLGPVTRAREVEMQDDGSLKFSWE